VIIFCHDENVNKKFKLKIFNGKVEHINYSSDFETLGKEKGSCLNINNILQYFLHPGIILIPYYYYK